MRLEHALINLSFLLEKTQITTERIVIDLLETPIPSHSHGNGCFELHYVISGTGTVTLQDIPYPLSPQTFYITGPHVTHAQYPNPNDPVTEYCMYIKVALDDVSLLSDSDFCIHTFLQTASYHREQSEFLGSFLIRIFQETRQQLSGYRIIVESKVKELLVLLGRAHSLPQKHLTSDIYNEGHERIREEYLNHTGFSSYLHSTDYEHATADKTAIIMDEYFLFEYKTASLETLSCRLNLSCRQTERLIWQYYGKTFQQKKTDARMAAAAILLHQPYKITQIAEKLGYGSIEHFSSAFRHYYQMSPSAFRKQFLGENFKKQN